MHKHLSAVLGLSLLLAACTPKAPDQPTNNPPGSTIQLLGSVSVNHNSSLKPSITFLVGNFVQVQELSGYNPALRSSADMCQLGATLDGPSPVQILKSLSAGPALTFKSGSSTYATATLDTSASGTSSVGTTYNYLGKAESAPPQNLTVDIPGNPAGFPAFTAVPIPLAGSFKLTAPNDLSNIAPTTTFSWTNPTNNAEFLVGFTVVQQTPPMTFFCSGPDDGSFSMPASFQNSLKAAGFTGGSLVMALRDGTHATTSGSALLLTKSVDLLYPSLDVMPQGQQQRRQQAAQRLLHTLASPGRP